MVGFFGPLRRGAFARADPERGDFERDDVLRLVFFLAAIGLLPFDRPQNSAHIAPRPCRGRAVLDNEIAVRALFAHAPLVGFPASVIRVRPPARLLRPPPPHSRRTGDKDDLVAELIQIALEQQRRAIKVSASAQSRASEQVLPILMSC